MTIIILRNSLRSLLRNGGRIMHDEIWHALSYCDIAYRLAIAILFGTIIGLERQWKSRTAGLRTNVLVVIGTSSFVMFGMGFPLSDSTARLACQIISGIGFLGAGVIMRDGGNIRGINTAATLWCSASVGMFVGRGDILMGFLITMFIFLTNLLVSPLIKIINKRPLLKDTESEHYYSISISCNKREEMHIRELLTQQVNDDPAIHLRKLESKKLDGASGVQVSASMMSMGNYNLGIESVVGRLSLDHRVKSINWTNKTDLE